MTAALGLPMKKREGVPTTYSVPVARLTPKIDQIKVEGAFKSEPALSGEDYEEILRIMKNMVQVMELSPQAFHGMGEEDLRSHFLVQLNGAFKGQATGETFNYQGKTDILIRVDGRNVFIAECKFWKVRKGIPRHHRSALVLLELGETRRPLCSYSTGTLVLVRFWRTETATARTTGTSWPTSLPLSPP
jgi:hypothetical protein